jgi:hypothetical protein
MAYMVELMPPNGSRTTQLRTQQLFRITQLHSVPRTIYTLECRNIRVVLFGRTVDKALPFFTHTSPPRFNRQAQIGLFAVCVFGPEEIHDGGVCVCALHCACCIACGYEYTIHLIH